MADKNTIESVTSRALAAEMGSRLAKLRLARNVTQKTLAADAGIGLRTLRRVESGQSSTLDNFLRVAIALGLTDDLLKVLPAHEIRPIERVDSRGLERRRARAPRTRVPEEPWSWGEESRD